MTPLPCPKCAGTMAEGIALEQTFRGLPDFAGDHHPVTISPGGPGKLVPCLKCVECGFSVSVEEQTP